MEFVNFWKKIIYIGFYLVYWCYFEIDICDFSVYEILVINWFKNNFKKLDVSCYVILIDCNNIGDWSVCRLYIDEDIDIFFNICYEKIKEV